MGHGPRPGASGGHGGQVQRVYLEPQEAGRSAGLPMHGATYSAKLLISLKSWPACDCPGGEMGKAVAAMG
jgi:hypothetical protein